VKNPAPSNLAFATPAPQTAISVVDQRAGSERVFFSGVLASTLTVDGTPIDAPAYLSRNLQAELASRGVPAQVSAGEGAFPAHGPQVLPHAELPGYRFQPVRQLHLPQRRPGDCGPASSAWASSSSAARCRCGASTRSSSRP
jgi:hypothetical protein